MANFMSGIAYQNLFEHFLDPHLVIDSSLYFQSFNNKYNEIKELIKSEIDPLPIIKELLDKTNSIVINNPIKGILSDPDSFICYLREISYLSFLANTSIDPAIRNILNSPKFDELNQNILLCALTETQLIRDIKEVHFKNNEALISIYLSMIWSYTGSRESTYNREFSIGNLLKLNYINKNINIPTRYINGCLMFASYAYNNKKDISKRAINQKLSRILEDSFSEYLPTFLGGEYIAPSLDKKPIMFIVHEWFNPYHSIYRALYKAIRSCKESFYLVSIEWPGYVDTLNDDIFDERIIFDLNSGESPTLQYISFAKKFNPAIIFFPSIGMCSWTTMFSNIRCSSIQVASIGHGSSSQSSCIDYFLVESDISGLDQFFSEKLIKLPPFTMPFSKPPGISYDNLKQLDDDLIKIGCIATSMKINPMFLDTLKTAAAICPRIFINFYIGDLTCEIDKMRIKQLISNHIENFNIYYNQPFQNYVDSLHNSHFFVTPFPFGGMNGMVDSVSVGKVSIVLKGENFHESFDAGLWARIDTELGNVVVDLNEYVNAIIRFANNLDYLKSIQDYLIQRSQVLYQGYPSNFCTSLLELYSNEYKNDIIIQ